MVVAVDNRVWLDGAQRVAHWMAYALDPGDTEAAVRREVDTHLARHPGPAGQRALLIDLLTAKSAGAREDGAVLGGLRYEDTGSGASIASMAGWLVDRNPARTVDDEIADNLAGLSVARGIDQEPPTVRRVRLPYGPAVRLETSRRAPSGAATPVEHRMVFRTVEYHVPLLRPPASLLFVRFMTSDLAGAGRLGGEFETIVARLPVAPP
jgi:hypothetical protein